MNSQCGPWFVCDTIQQYCVKNPDWPWPSSSVAPNTYPTPVSTTLSTTGEYIFILLLRSLAAFFMNLPLKFAEPLYFMFKPFLVCRANSDCYPNHYCDNGYCTIVPGAGESGIIFTDQKKK